MVTTPEVGWASSRRASMTVLYHLHVPRAIVAEAG